MKLKPLHDRVIVKRLEEERKTAGGIVIGFTMPPQHDSAQCHLVRPSSASTDAALGSGSKSILGQSFHSRSNA